MREILSRRSYRAVLVFFAALALAGGGPLCAGRIERGVSYLRAGNDQRALDVFSEVWASGEAEERQLAMFYLDLVVGGAKDRIPSVEEARAAIRRRALEERQDAAAGEDVTRVKPTAVIYHTKKARRLDEEISVRYGDGEVSTGSAAEESGEPQKTAPRAHAYHKKTAAPPGVKAAAAASLRARAKKRDDGASLTASRASENYKFKKTPSAGGEKTPASSRYKFKAEEEETARASRSSPRAREASLTASRTSERYKFKKTPAGGAQSQASSRYKFRAEDEETGQSSAAASRGKSKNAEEGAEGEEEAAPSSPYKETVVADGGDSGGRGDVVAAGVRGKARDNGASLTASRTSERHKFKKTPAGGEQSQASSRYKFKAEDEETGKSAAAASRAKAGERDEVESLSGSASQRGKNKNTEEGAEAEEEVAPSASPYRETVVADGRDSGGGVSGGREDIVATGALTVSRAGAGKNDENELSAPSQPYKETVIAGADGGGEKLVAVASAERRKETPKELRSSDTPAAKPFDASGIKVQASGGETGAPVPARYGAEASSVAVVASSMDDGAAAPDIKTVRLKGKKKTFTIEDAYAVDNEPKDEFVSEVCFRTNELELADNAMSAVAAAAAKLSKGGTLMVRGLSSPSENNAENLAKIRAKLIERLLKKKFDIPSKKMTVEWGIGVNKNDQKVLLLVRA